MQNLKKCEFLGPKPPFEKRAGCDGPHKSVAEVRGGGRECQDATAQEQPRRATLRRRSGSAAGRSYPSLRPGAAAETSNPTSKEQWLRAQEGREELPHVLGQGPRQGGATPRPRGGGCERRRAERSYSTFKIRRGGGEEIPLVQGKEQRLRFAGAAVKRYPTPKVKETQVRR